MSTTTNERPLNSARLLALVLASGTLIGGCSTGSSQRQTTATTTASSQSSTASVAGSGTTTVATTAAAASTKNAAGWTAVIDGNEVPAPMIDMGDDAVVRRILDEGKNRNKVMEHLTYLTQKIGPRLTGSTRVKLANEWCRDQYVKWGLSNPHLEEWGTIATGFDRGPSSGKLVLRREPRNDDGSEPATYETLRELQITTLSWSAGTQGAVRGKVFKEPKTDEEFDTLKDKLAGAWILIDAPSPVGQRGIRGMTQARYELRKSAAKKKAEGADLSGLKLGERIALAGVAGYVSTSRDERIWTGGAPGWRETTVDQILPEPHVVIRGSDYDSINSRLADGEPVELEFNLEHTFNPGPIPVYNTIAEIPGTVWPEQVVVISGHLDSWDGPGSQGCTDNGTGTAVTLEAARLLVASGAKPKRTIRFIHWTGEEQGLLGSKGYIEKHKDLLPNFSAVFVDDGGTNYEGGLPAPEVSMDMLAAATAPTNNQFYSETDKKYLNVNIRKAGRSLMRGGSSDHASFNNVGVPGFFWDEIGRADYQFGWHTQNDTLSLAIPEYLMQSSTNAAITAYRLACAPTLLPRPTPAPASESDGERPRRRQNSEPAAPAAGQTGQAEPATGGSATGSGT